MQPPTARGGLIVSWSGMRGIVTLAAALALPTEVGGTPFPLRGLIVLTAFSVVLGTLVLQGLTLRPLLEALDLHDDDPVGQEVGRARERALQAALTSLDADTSPEVDTVRQELVAHLRPVAADADGTEARQSSHDEIHRRALTAARQVVLEMRASDDIGDDAFHQLEEEFDWIEMGSGAREEP